MKKPKSSEKVCGNCVWWDGAFCDNEDDKETDEFDTCPEWINNKSPYYKEDK